MSAACRSCSADIVWAKAPKTARSMPLDAKPVDPNTPGALVLVDGWAYGLTDLVEKMALRQGISLPRAQELARSEYDWHLSHFATCPAAASHRRAR